MYLIRRVFKVKPGTARKAVKIIAQMGKVFEDAGQRSLSRVYMSGGSVPGPSNTIYMDWIEEQLLHPLRRGNKVPDDFVALRDQLRDEYLVDSYIEFYEMYAPRKRPNVNP